MKKHLVHICMLFLVLFSGLRTSAQTYPITTFVNLTPPYSSYLPDYADPFNNKLKVLLTLNDFTIPSYQVKLRFKIEGTGYSITSTDLTSLPVYTVTPGVPIEISGNDLAPYLSTSNLVFTGVNPIEYERTKVLPEGPTSICVEVIDYSNPNQSLLGNPACAQAWFSLNDPPLLNLPFCGSEIPATDPQNIVFSWTPLSMGSPFGPSTEYVFELFEVRPNYAGASSGEGDDATGAATDPNVIVTSTLPIYTTTTTNTMLNYGIIEPQLQLGMEYVWRVQAREMDGRAIYRNQGYSAVCTFTYGNIAEELANDIVLELEAQGIGPRLAVASWNMSASFTSYILEVRKTGNPDFTWFPYETIEGSYNISNLEPETEYECRVKGLVGTSFESDYSNIATFNTTAKTEYACGSTSMPGTATGITPLLNLTAGTFLTYGQFEMRVTQVEPLGVPGRYKGYGEITVPFILTSVPVRFEDILVDEYLMVREGRADALTDGVAGLINMMDREFVDGVIDAIEVDTLAGEVTVHFGDEEKTFKFPEEGPLVIEDDSGLIYIIDPDGSISYDGNITIDYEEMQASKGYQIYFLEDEDQSFGFDGLEHLTWRSNYGTIVLGDGHLYPVPYKSLGAGKGDVVKAIFRNTTDASEEISFETRSGTSVPYIQDNDSTYTLQLGGLDKDEDILAYNGEDKIGKLTVKVYEELVQKVTIIPLGSTTVSASIEEGINEIYNQANATMEVVIDEAYTNTTWDLNADGKMEAPSDVGLMNKYSDEMKALREAYFEEHPDYDKESIFIFVVDEFDQADLDGYMVRGKGLGFVVEGSGDNVYAHEIGHGAFGLTHTFPEVDQGTTHNLLDYSGTHATHFTAKQWDAIHSPMPVISFLDDEEDGGMSYASLVELEPFKNELDGSFTFFNPNGYYITLPASTQQVYLSTLERFKNDSPTPIGSLIGFVDEEGIYYKAIRVNSSDIVYRDTIDSENGYVDSLTILNQPTKGILGISYVLANTNDPLAKTHMASITTSYFQAPSPINQETYDDQNEVPINDVYMHPTSFIPSESYGNITPSEYVELLNVGDEIVVIYNNVGLPNNSLIDIQATEYFGGGRNAYQFLKMEFDENTPIQEYLVFYDFINSPFIELISKLNCLNTLISREKGIYLNVVKHNLEVEHANTSPLDNVLNIHDLIGETIDRYANINNYAAEVVEEGLVPLFTYIDNVGSDCFYQSLNYENRVLVMNAVVSDDSYWTYNDQSTLNELFIHASGEEKVELVKKFKTNNWLDTINQQLFQWFDIRDDKDFYSVKEFYNSVTAVFVSNYEKFDRAPKKRTSTFYAHNQQIVLNNSPPSSIHSTVPIILDLPGTYTIETNYSEYPILIGDKRGVYTLIEPDPAFSYAETVYAVINESSEDVPYEYANGKYTISGNYLLSSACKNSIPFDRETEARMPQNTFLNLNESYEIDPFELVEVHFTSTFGSQDIEAGTSILIPAYELTLYEKAVTLHKVQFYSRLVLDAVEISVALMTAPATFGGSLQLLGAIAAIDAFVAIDQDSQESLEAYNASFYQNWNIFKSAVDMVSLAGSATFGLYKVAAYIGGAVKNRKAILVGMMLNHMVRKAPNIYDDVENAFSARKLLYLESIGTGKNLDELADIYLWNGQRILGNLPSGNSNLLLQTKTLLRQNGLTDVSSLNKLDNWNTNTLSKFNEIIQDPIYAGIINEFRLNSSLFDYFKLIEETWWAKYPLAGLSKRTGNTIPEKFKNYIGEIEITTTGTSKLKLKATNLEESTPQYIGKLFDDVVTQKVTESWTTGNFDDFPVEISEYLADLKNKGYKLVVEPHVSINSKNPKPDLLFFGSKEIAGVTISDVKYLEIKYLDDVGYTSAQKEITNNLPAVVTEKNGQVILDRIGGDEVVSPGQAFTINDVKKFTVNKSTIDLELK
ncbi:MAG: fibronectin type III domain-containing protein [Crocinitomicaceae bacterium]|nr:fibronectin type III domain-containing protein [Crocinitomicaceae bacterium]